MPSPERHDAIVLGAGIYGLYAAGILAGRGMDVLVLEHDPEPFTRATYVNQARVHMGYHYPRSLSTAEKSAHYFRRFVEDFGFCVNKSFDQVYATSARGSWTSAGQFRRFCEAAGIPCEEVPASRWFRRGAVDGAFLTTEYTYDARVLGEHMLSGLSRRPNVRVRCGEHPLRAGATPDGERWALETTTGLYETPYVVNATYASVNQVSRLFGADAVPIKYELCEIILCGVDGGLSGTGLTVMDGPFFSIMPFGMTGLHSLTSVTFTPHEACHEDYPRFSCMGPADGCSPAQLGNCDSCPARPPSAWPYMSQLARSYMRDGLRFSYERSLFSMKPIMRASEVDDSRPTVIRVQSERPRLVSVLSGKVNTVYDLEGVL